MAEFDAEKTRSVCLVSHASAGKTSLAEAMLFNRKATTRLGKVEDGNTIADYNEDEIERKISISAKALHVVQNDSRIFIIDTPGYADFVGEVVCAVKAADSGIVLVDATGGIEVGTERAWGFLDEVNAPRLIFINKLDKENTDFFNTVEEVRERFGKACVPFQFPIGKGSGFKEVVNLLTGDLSKLEGDIKSKAESSRQELIEDISESKDELLEKYLEGKELAPEELSSGLRAGISAGKIVPILCGSATANIGVEELLDAIAKYMPGPKDLPARKAANAANPEEAKEIANDESAPFSAFVFKSISDPYVGQLTLFRVFSGTLNSNSSFYNSTKKVRERFGQIYLMQGKEQVPAESVKAGDIAALAKLKDSATGDTLCDEKNQILFEGFKLPEAAISVSVKPHSKQDEEKIMGGLTRLAAEDTSFKVSRDLQTKELIISGMGDLHLDVMVGRLKKRFGVGVDIGTPKVPYKETVKAKASVQGKYKKQTGGRGQYGDCWIEVEPLPKGEDFEFVDKIVGGAIPRNFIPSVEKGIKEAMQRGVLAGYPVVDVKVTLYDGSYHTVDSSDIAFKIAGSMAFKKAQEEAKPVLLEPIMNVEVVVPDEYMGQITGDLNSKRGRIMSMEPRGKMQVVKATVPLAEMFKYASELKSMTGGRGTYTMQFSHYEEVPAKISQTVIAQAKEQQEELKK